MRKTRTIMGEVVLLLELERLVFWDLKGKHLVLGECCEADIIGFPSHILRMCRRGAWNHLCKISVISPTISDYSTFAIPSHVGEQPSYDLYGLHTKHISPPSPHTDACNLPLQGRFLIALT